MNFKEIGRIQTTDTTWVVVSEMKNGEELKGYSITKYMETEAYTGFTKGGLSIPDESVVEFLKLFSKDNLKEALDDKSS